MVISILTSITCNYIIYYPLSEFIKKGKNLKSKNFLIILQFDQV
jgi:hypothetical protein